MAESDRSRSPMPLRNRLEPRGQVPAPALPFFPRWCGPMSASVRHFQNMSRPQQRPNWSGNSSGPYMTGRMWSQPPPNPPSSWMSQQFPPLPPHNSLPPTLPHPPQPCPSTQPCPPTIPCPPTQPSSAPGIPSISPLNLDHMPLQNRIHLPDLGTTRPPKPMASIQILTGRKTGIITTTRRSMASPFPDPYGNRPSLKGWTLSDVILCHCLWQP